MNQMLSMSDFINKLTTFDESLNVWFEKEKLPINSDDGCIILNDEEIQKFLSPRQKGYLLGIYQVNDIVENLYQQNEKYSSKDLIKAVNFYLQNDAFISDIKEPLKSIKDSGNNQK